MDPPTGPRVTGARGRPAPLHWPLLPCYDAVRSDEPRKPTHARLATSALQSPDRALAYARAIAGIRPRESKEATVHTDDPDARGGTTLASSPGRRLCET